MNCFYHSERSASATCQECGKFLCHECASLLDPPICKDCVALYVQSEKAKMIKAILLGLALGIACSVFIEDPAGILFACVPFGWMALTSITPKIFLFMPIVGWVFYFFIKFILSFFIGWIALPIKIYKWIKMFGNAKKILG